MEQRRFRHKDEDYVVEFPARHPLYQGLWGVRREDSRDYIMLGNSAEQAVAKAKRDVDSFDSAINKGFEDWFNKEGTMTTTARVVLPARIVDGLLMGDAMCNQGFEEDLASFEILKAASGHPQSRKHAYIVEGDASLLRHIADYLDGIEASMGPRDRFGFTSYDAREGAALIHCQLAE